jgi:hypothetical protein
VTVTCSGAAGHRVPMADVGAGGYKRSCHPS